MANNPNDLNKTKIGISWFVDKEKINEDKDVQGYIQAITLAGGEPVYLEQCNSVEDAKHELSKIDCLIMAGGEDIHPNLYSEEVLPTCGKINDIRDTSDCFLFKEAIKQDMPVLAVCRGMQLLNALCGGNLYQDLNTQHPTNIVHKDPEGKEFTYHTINVDGSNILSEALGGKGTYEVNSWHHQGIKGLGQNLEVVAKADDDMIEGIILNTSTYIYGVQFHPERLVVAGRHEYLSVFKSLIDARKK